MPEEAAKRVWIGAGGFGGGSIVGSLATHAIETVEKVTAPPSACANALEIMSTNLSVCMQLCGGG
jgi:hypothetical protein